MLSHSQIVHFWRHSVLHIRKAEHLRIPNFRLKVNFRHPMKRQIFGDTSGQDPNLHLALCLKLNFIPKYIDLRTFVVKISRVTFTYFAHRFDCSGQVWSQGSQNWFKYFRDWGIPTLKNGEMPPLLSGSYVRYRGVWRRRAGKKSVFAKQKQTFDPWPPNGSRVWCLRVR